LNNKSANYTPSTAVWRTFKITMRFLITMMILRKALDLQSLACHLSGSHAGADSFSVWEATPSDRAPRAEL
jgi:hypothetical protein